MASIRTRFAKLNSLSEDDRTALLRDIRVEILDAQDSDDLDRAEEFLVLGETVKQYNDMVDEIKSIELSDEELEELDAAEEDRKTERPSETDEGDEDENDTTEDEDGDSVESEELEAVAASGAKFKAPESHQPKHTTRLSVTPRAGADFGALTAGASFSSMEQVNEAFVDRIDAMRGTSGGDGEKRTVVSLTAAIEEARQLSQSDPRGNMDKIESVTGEDALVASGGWCAPLPVNYNILGVGSAVRPVRDSLPTFGATRGGIRYIAPPVLGAYNNAISLWTAANDVNPTNPTKKPSLKVSCAEERQADVDAVTLSLIFGNLMTRAFPELVQRHNELALIQHARFAERNLLNQIASASTKVTTAAKIGATRDLLVSVARASAAYRNRHRIPRGVKLRAIMPEWVRDVLREDIASNLQVENVSVTDATVDRWFADRGLNITWHIDDVFSDQADDAVLNDFPEQLRWWIFAEGTFLFLDGGTLDLGVVRDSNLVDTNDYRTFVETFEGLAKVGIEAMQVTSDLSIGLAEVVSTP